MDYINITYDNDVKLFNCQIIRNGYYSGEGKFLNGRDVQDYLEAKQLIGIRNETSGYKFVWGMETVRAPYDKDVDEMVAEGMCNCATCTNDDVPTILFDNNEVINVGECIHKETEARLPKCMGGKGKCPNLPYIM